MFQLSELLTFDSIVIQSHDNPDADSIASAFAIYTYLKQKDKDVEIVYSGSVKISKCNLQLIIEELEIPITYVEEIKKPDLLICVDCQYGEGNVTKFDAKNIAVIDHHLQTKGQFDLGVIESQLGSCSTLVWDLLRGENFNFEDNKNVATALYYGLFSDTNNFTEINHPLDKDIRDGLNYDADLINRLRFNNLTLEELEIAGVALIRNENHPDRRYALFKAEPCDPNILGVISDLGLQVNTVDVCIVYNQFPNGAKISVRSCSKEVMASEYTEYLTEGVGTGGGHRDKAGGFIQKSAIDALGMTITEYMNQKTAEYFDSFDVILSSNHKIDTSRMRRYRKKPIPMGYVLSTQLFKENTPIMIRTIDGDSHTETSEDVYLMVGLRGEIYPIKSKRFHSYYDVSNKTVDMDYAYAPTVKDENSGEVKNIIPYLKSCVSLGKTQTFMKPLDRNTKVFTDLDSKGYMYGRVGDYLAIKCEDVEDVYIVKRDVFFDTYEECK